jgi:hypothetical protein
VRGVHGSLQFSGAFPALLAQCRSFPAPIFLFYFEGKDGLAPHSSCGFQSGPDLAALQIKGCQSSSRFGVLWCAG